MTEIESLIRQQLDANRSRNLLYRDAPGMMEIAPEFANDLEALVDAARAEPEADAPLNAAARLAAEAFAERVAAINPYLPIGAEQMAQLEGIYRDTLRTIERFGDSFAVLRRRHYPALAAWVAELYPPQLRAGLEHAPAVQGLAYGQYPAMMQIELLGLEPEKLTGPVLDIGCGSRGNLVRRLRALGVEAYGIDRHLEVSAPYLKQADWFAYAFGHEQWAALISSMAFTNHLTYALKQDASQLDGYLDRYTTLLAALKVGGTFFYAPSIPRIEDELSTKTYRVRRSGRPTGVMVSAVTRLS